LKYILSFFSIFTITILIAIFSSSYTIKIVAQEVAPKYNISFDNISGDILSGINIKNLRYKDKELAKNILFSYNPISLFNRNLNITNISIDALNLDNLLFTIKEFSSNKIQKEEIKEQENNSLPISISLNNFDITIYKFKRNEIKFKKVEFKIANLLIKDNNISIKNINSTIETNIANLSINGSIIKNILKLKTDVIDKPININLKYNIDKATIDSKVNIANNKISINGKIDNKVDIKADITSIEKLLKTVNSIYKIDTPNISGNINLKSTIYKLKDISLSLNSKSITITNKKDKTIISDIAMNLKLNQNKLNLNNYKLTYDNNKIFSTKESNIKFQDNFNLITLNQFWINDELTIKGNYNIKGKKGNLKIDAKNFTLKNKFIDSNLKIDIDAILNKNSNFIKGLVAINGGRVFYDIEQKSFATDDDIIFINRKKKKEDNKFMQSLKLDIKLSSSKPLLYKTADIKVKTSLDLKILKKRKEELKLFGDVTLLKNSSYKFENKKIVLQKSKIRFKSKISRPILDIKANYKKGKYLITIIISGVPSEPNINFMSEPYLSKEEILSVILLDSDVGANTNNSEDISYMLGGAMAKSILSNIGIKLDHLILSANNKFEIGKKVSEKITIIYVNDEVSSVKVRYDYSDSIEADFTVNQESSSADIFYKKRY